MSQTSHKPVLAGEPGSEEIMPLGRTRGGKLGVSAEGGGGGFQVNMPVTINNNTDANITAERRTNTNGQQELIITVENNLARRVGSGEGQLFKAVQRTFGLKVSGVRK